VRTANTQDSESNSQDSQMDNPVEPKREKPKHTDSDSSDETSESEGGKHEIDDKSKNNDSTVDDRVVAPDEELQAIAKEENERLKKRKVRISRKLSCLEEEE